MENLTQYKKRQMNLTEEEKEKERKIRNKKNKERYANNKKSRELARYREHKSKAKRFLNEMIKNEDKQEFKEYLKKL